MTDVSLPGYGTEITLDEALEQLNEWSIEETVHCFLYRGKHEGSVSILSKIGNASANYVVSHEDKFQLFFRLDQAKILYGPLVVMEYPVWQESSMEGLHFFFESGGYLFISRQEELLNIELSATEVS